MVFESIIKAAKRAISAILTEADVTGEELYNCRKEVKILLNSRLITTVSDDSKDEPVSQTFITGQIGGDRLIGSVHMTQFNPR